jgi:hypothetical protein
MALGRVAGPGVGGLLLGAGSYLAVGIEAVVVTGVAAAVVVGVEVYRRGRTSPASRT